MTGAPNDDAPGGGDRLDRSMRLAERSVYVVIAVLLTISAAIALVAIAWELLTGLDDGALAAVETTLDGLLLVFIFVELLGAVRATVIEQKLVAEPFLVVGIIAAIKEIVLATLQAGSKSGSALEDAMLEVVGLGVVVLLLALAAFLVRRKEREPTERDAGSGGD
ncbi:phosphate-starvation-inducible PsiE family protein [Dermatobacter hominis]|uniref:phosphate-starvation-inducible PsiE family protein n=1 Tax=Dermatobacter hominis TaxID=2884263 RepID=UPI001D124025|nr:phosphate-starvation-inducible PsiE family protein [Dermatobacter hominis]UDY34166.1 phosphate-starvation-inducible PsiE family protein [Dermatobacter hominis]